MPTTITSGCCRGIFVGATFSARSTVPAAARGVLLNAAARARG
jgi:hypothetical protein